MAQPNSPSTVESGDTPPQDPFATPLTINDLEAESDNPDDWEYEYSTTETEIYYVTLDLTTPDVRPTQRARGYEGPGNKRGKWLNPGLGHLSRKDRIEQAPRSKEGEDVTAEVQSLRPDPDLDDDDEPSSPESNGPQEGEPNIGVVKDRNGKVQIMGLHTRNPYVSYNGHVYSCQWASNIGTEMLFTEHDPDNALPSLRSLPGNVDLLAASSARIISNSVLLEPKPHIRSQPKKSRNGNNKDPSISIPIGHTASQKRKDQARFLESLMQIKEAKGEEDDVTIYTRKRLSAHGWKKHLVSKREEERKKLQRVVRANKNDQNVEKAKERLMELDREEEMMKEAEEKWLKESRPVGRGRVRIHRDDGGIGETPRKRVRMDEEEGEGLSGVARTPHNISTPTPRRWEMEDGGEEDSEEGGEDDMEQYDEDANEEIFYEDEYGDEDDPGEDDDAPSEDEDP